MSKKKENLYEKLQQYQKSDYYPFHMPGHKRNLKCLPDWNPYGMDITEIDGFDNLHDAKEILAQQMEEIALFRGAEDSYLLVNGTTCGLLAAIGSCTRHGDEILVARNCHKAVYHGIYLNALVPHYIYPQIHPDFGCNGGISPRIIENMLITYPNTKLVVITSPTYEGVVSDVQAIAEVVHGFGIPLLVDQAHGAHFGMEKSFPKSAVSCGADLVVESVHKTLPAFTQTALLHRQGDYVKKEQIKKFLGIYESSSPSYPLMAGISWCMDFCRREKEAFYDYGKSLGVLRENIGKLKHFRLLEPQDMEEFMDGIDYDIGKIVISVQDSVISGQELYDLLLEKYHLQMEMASMRYVIAMTSVMDTEDGFARLEKALTEIDRMVEDRVKKENQKVVIFPQVQNEMMYSPYEAEGKEKEWILVTNACGKIAGEYVYLYPPGIPIFVPGERIQEKLLSYILECKKSGLDVKGIQDGKICVCKELE